MLRARRGQLERGPSASRESGTSHACPGVEGRGVLARLRRTSTPDVTSEEPAEQWSETGSSATSAPSKPTSWSDDGTEEMRVDERGDLSWVMLADASLRGRWSSRMDVGGRSNPRPRGSLCCAAGTEHGGAGRTKRPGPSRAAERGVLSTLAEQAEGGWVGGQGKEGTTRDGGMACRWTGGRGGAETSGGVSGCSYSVAAQLSWGVSMQSSPVRCSRMAWHPRRDQVASGSGSASESVEGVWFGRERLQTMKPKPLGRPVELQRGASAVLLARRRSVAGPMIPDRDKRGRAVTQRRKVSGGRETGVEGHGRLGEGGE
ncbi:hypothetical protein JHW43_009249 [Diplocarpon mali]|nr:hypothetical protein JHW43_009249 [Diplocarpon mali]